MSTDRKHKYYDRDREYAQDRQDNKRPKHEHPDTPAISRSLTQIDWHKYRLYLDGMFFKKTDVIVAGSEAHKEFWEFLQNYIRFLRKKEAVQPPEQVQKDNKISSKKSRLGLPLHYDERYTINFSFLSDKTVKMTSEEMRSRGDLTDGELLEFRRIVHMYWQFLQKRKFAKLQKIKQEKMSLPIYQFKPQIMAALEDKQHQVFIVAGDTGCGKSTQVVQYVMEYQQQQEKLGNYEMSKVIAVTQPRRIATISLSRRIAYETLNEHTNQIGYQIRFDSSRARETRIIFLTEGLLLRQLASDPKLSQYSFLIVDEVHERHIHGDFLLGILHTLVTNGTHLKIILMSATINIELFSNYFNAPVIMVPGRTYPIKVSYIPLSPEEREVKAAAEEKGDKKDQKNQKQVIRRQRLNPKPYLSIMQHIDDTFPQHERGDLLIFLSGMDEILTLAEEIKMATAESKRWIVLMLHSSLSIEEQDKVKF